MAGHTLPDGRGGGSNGSSHGSSLIMQLRKSSEGEYMPMSLEKPKATEFEMQCFRGRSIFLHRPDWTYDNPETGELYPYRQLFQGRKRLWEWRLQGQFTRRPGMLYVGIELEEYVPVNFATRSMMRAMLPLIQAALQCKMVHHEVGDPNDSELRPAVVAPLWAADNTLVHDDPADAPDIAEASLPMGMNRKASRQFWETVWDGGGPSFDDDGEPSGPTFTIALWGPSQLLDLRNWVFRKLPLVSRPLAMEPFCGKQPVHIVVYELEDGATAKRHLQECKIYHHDMRLMPWNVYAARTNCELTLDLTGMAAPTHEDTSPQRDEDGAESFRSARSDGSSPEIDPEDQQVLLNVALGGAAMPPVPEPTVQRESSGVLRLVTRCCRCRQARESNGDALEV